MLDITSKSEVQVSVEADSNVTKHEYDIHTKYYIAQVYTLYDSMCIYCVCCIGSHISFRLPCILLLMSSM